MDALKKEIKLVTSYIDKNRKVSQIHYGGGTPNSIPASYLQEINELVFSQFSFIEDPEIAIECNPAYFDFNYLTQLKEAGFNRFSLGIQDFNEKVLKGVNREPSALPVIDIKNFLKDGDDKIAVNLDFIYGLPFQNKKSFIDTIKKAVEIKPDRLVTFSYAHVPWMKKHQQILEKRGLPTPEEKTDMFFGGYEILTNAGYAPIGFDHFVLPGDELNRALENKMLHRNFQGYCTRRTTGQVYAFGVSAISQLEKAYIQNVKEIDPYIQSLENKQLPVEKGCIPTKNQIITREIITELMCNLQVNWEQLAKKMDYSVDELKSGYVWNEIELQEMQKDGILLFNNDGIKVIGQGWFFVRNIAALLDPEYEAQANKYSKTV